jgi:hypothetical protein
VLLEEHSQVPVEGRGIRRHSEKDVIRKLGSPDASWLEFGTKSLYYRALGIRLRLIQEQVYMLRISDPRYERR